MSQDRSPTPYPLRGWLTVAICLWIAGKAAAQFPMPAEPPLSSEVRLDDLGGAGRSHLDTVDAFLADGQWDEAIETLRRLMENQGDKLIPVEVAGDEASRLFLRHVPLRRYGQMRLVRMHFEHPEALALYRQRVDPLAQRWYEQAVADRDIELLQRVVQEMFASSFGDEALNTLAELVLERGDFATARACWQRLSPRFFTPATDDASFPLPPGRPWWQALGDVDLDEYWPRLEPLLEHDQVPPGVLVYPDSNLNPADALARLVLVSILESSPRRAAFELNLLGRLYPDAAGRISGREGKYTELLGSLLDESREWPPLASRDQWPTFAGNDRRNQTAPGEVDAAIRPIWNAPLARLSAASETIGQGRPRVAEAADALLAYHPVVRNGVVFLNEFSRIRALDAQTGKPWPRETAQGGIFDTRQEPAMLATLRGEFVGAPRSTITLHGDRLYARMGSPVTGHAQPDETRTQSRGFLVGLDLSAEGRLLPGFPIRLDGAEWRYWEFEGSPLADHENVFIAMRHRDNVNAKLHVVCFDSKTGEVKWRSPLIVAADSLSHGTRDEVTHTLLSRQDDRLFINTNLGVVACVRVRDGRLEWVTRYPRSSFRTRDPDDSDRHFFRDLNPCLVEKDLVIAAPSDCDRIFALHAPTGRLVWATEPERAVDAVHLLGVGQGNLIASGDYLYWFDVESGMPVGQYPHPGTNEAGHGRPEPRGVGRGLLAGSHVYFPTRDAIHVFEQRTRRTARGWEPRGVRTIELGPREATGGHLFIAEGKLFIATADRLLAFDEYGASGPSQ